MSFIFITTKVYMDISELSDFTIFPFVKDEKFDSLDPGCHPLCQFAASERGASCSGCGTNYLAKKKTASWETRNIKLIHASPIDTALKSCY